MPPPSFRSSSATRRHFLSTLLATLAFAFRADARERPQAGQAPSAPGAQRPFDAKELAAYRLTTAAFSRFSRATRLLAAAMEHDPRFAREPLFTREISVSGDAAEMATSLEHRLDTEPALAAALFAADISAHEYTAFAIALFGARLAHGFLKSGAMRRVPPGVAADNVEFVAAHDAEVASLLKLLKLE